MVENYHHMIESTLRPPDEILKHALDKLIEKDHQKIFMYPVDEKEVPGYHKVIKKPMDFKKMQKKLKNSGYRTIADIRGDFDVMINNCALFNKDNMYYWRYGNQMRSLGTKILKAAEQDEQIATSGQLMAEVIPIIFDPEDIDEEMRSFLAQYSPVLNDRGETAKRKFSATSNRKRSIGDGNGGLKDTKIIDYFKPATSPQASASRARKNTVANTPLSAPNKKRTRVSSGAYRCNQTSEDDETDTEDATTSADEETTRSRKRPAKSNKTKTIKAPKRNSPRYLAMEIKQEHQEQEDEYSHDDIVWAPLKSDRFPARVFDRNFIALEDDKSIVDKIHRLPIQRGHNQVLVVFFDVDRTVRYVQATELEHCDVNHRLGRGESSNVVTAFKRAKEYWDQYVNE